MRILTTAGDRIVGWSSVPIADRAGSKGQINDPAALGSLIDAAFEEHQLSRGHVSWALPGFGVTTRIIHLPNVPTHRLREAVVEEFDRVLDGSIEEYYLFWERLVGMVRPGTVFALAVPKSTVLPALESLEVAGIRPRTMDLRPIALARAVGESDSIVTNLEEGSIDVIMIERGVPVAIHSVPILGASVTRDAAQARLIEETERVLADYEDSNPDYPFNVDAPIYLTGNWATGIALSERLRYATRRPIGQLQPAGAYPPELPVAEYAVALGLSLKRK